MIGFSFDSNSKIVCGMLIKRCGKRCKDCWIQSTLFSFLKLCSACFSSNYLERWESFWLLCASGKFLRYWINLKNLFFIFCKTFFGFCFFSDLSRLFQWAIVLTPGRIMKTSIIYQNNKKKFVIMKKLEKKRTEWMSQHSVFCYEEWMWGQVLIFIQRNQWPVKVA